MRYKKFVTVSLVGIFLSAGIAMAAEEIIESKTPEQIREEMSASGLLAKAGDLLKEGDYYSATPYLTDYLDRMKDVDDRRVRVLKQNVRVKLGKIMVYQKDYKAAIPYLEEYMQNKPLFRRREVLKSLAVSYFENLEYEKSISTITNAFNLPPLEREKEQEEVKVEDISEEDLAGLTRRQLRRYRKDAQNVDKDLASLVSTEKPPKEMEYSLEDMVLLNMTLAESYSNLGEWEQSVEPYQFVIDHADKQERRGFAIMKLVTSLSKLDRFEEVRALIIDLAQTEARYDIRVNMAMMNAATSLFNEGQYDSALAMYRMILPRRVLADHHLVAINELREMAGMPEMKITLATNKLGRVETTLGYAYGERDNEIAAGGKDGEVQALEQEMPEGLMEKEEALGTLMTLQPYEDDVIYRMGQLYQECGRPWEALGAFDLTYKRSDSENQKNQAFCGALQVLVDPLKKYDRVEKRAIPFLDQYAEGIAPRQVAYYLTMAYQRQERYEDIKKLRPYLEGFVTAMDPTSRQYECELYYMQAIADLMLLNYKEAQTGFAQVLKDFPNSHQEENLRYWYAMTHLFLQDYETAFGMFEDYLKQFPAGDWVDSTWFQGGICLFALEKYDQAKERFTYVIDTFPDSNVYPDACSMRGDILGSEGFLDEAIRDYREAIATARKPNQAAYAVFQMSAIFEANEQYDEIITLVNSYLDRYGEEADVAKSAYWIGKTKMAQGLVDEAVAAYMDTIIRYGNDVRQDGVDLIISELMNISRGFDALEMAKLKQSIGEALRAADDVTLQLRLRVMLAELDGKEIELGQELITELDDLTKAPPPVLSVICDASFANKDYSRAEEILTIFQNYFEDSDYMRSAYKLRVYDLFSTGFPDEAMKVVMEAQDLYGADGDTAWIQLMKGRLEIEMGDFDAARETLKSILGVRFWRGVAYAEATYYLGELEEKAGNLKKAFAWYQRTYFLYKGLADGYWAAEGYLASARCLQALGRDGDMRNTYRAMLYDKYVNTLPQAETARTVLGADEVLEIQQKMAAGLQTNLVVTVESEESE